MELLKKKLEALNVQIKRVEADDIADADTLNGKSKEEILSVLMKEFKNLNKELESNGEENNRV